MTLPTVVDDSWYQRPPKVRCRISAGGVVVRRDGDQLLVALTREGKHPLYVLPKGGVEKGESWETAARREIEEETGITQLRFLEPLGKRERCGFHKSVWVVTHFFLYETTQSDTQPTDKRHHGVWWFPVDELPPMLWPEQRALIERVAPRAKKRLLSPRS